LKISYGKSFLEINIPQKNILHIIKPEKVEAQNEEELITNALANPEKSKNLNEFVESAKNILLIINDAFRATPTAKILASIFFDVRTKIFRVLIASGTHRNPTKEELKKILGKYYEFLEDRTVIHDAHAERDLFYLGATSYDTEVYLNNLAMQADKILVIGSVEPHYFAGFTGGRKSFLPGIAAYETIEHNHSLALSEKAKTFSLKDNPVHEDMMEAREKISKEIFAIETVLDEDNKIAAVYAGDLDATFLRATEKCKEIYAYKIDEPADIVLTIMKSPLDKNLYQAHKGIENGKSALKKDGIIILVAECSEGIGSDNFYRLLSSCQSPTEVLKEIKSNYKLGYHKSAKIAELCLRAQIWAKTEMKPQDLEKIFIKPISSLQNAIDEALKIKGKNAKIIVLEDGGITVPILEK